ncbi:MAG: hypothetical protein NWF00_08890 [Candidatus Bathyarchaeota archaeon]|nr:hypothetical protein [Candidatus Bathyarchaeota archaeon]
MKRHSEGFDMKMRIIKLTPEFLVERLQGKTSLYSNLPSDTELLDIKYDLFSKQVTAVVRSESFEDIADTFPIPEFSLTYSPSAKNSAAPSLSPTPTPLIPQTKPTLTSVVKPQPVPEKKPPVSTKTDTSMTEEEFTEDQRNLLSFSVDGDFVVIKPVRFLKGEWEDINDTVRSLGGRWVKGDIISYWEVPRP